MDVEFPENWCWGEFGELELVSLQSDLRDHREGMEETRLGEEK